MRFWNPDKINLTPDPVLAGNLRGLQTNALLELNDRFNRISKLDYLFQPRSPRDIAEDEEYARHDIFVATKFLDQLIEQATPINAEPLQGI